MTTTEGEVRAVVPVPRSRRTLLWVATTYFGEGLPWSFMHQMVLQFLITLGVSKPQMSATSLLHLSGTFKFLWSPLVDLFGRKRTWVWVMQIVLGLTMMAAAPLATRQTLPAFWAALVVMAIFSATHDIACDGFYMQALGQADRALYVGPRSAAFRAAMYVGNVALVGWASHSNWRIVFTAAGGLMIATAIVNALVMPRPPEAVRAARATFDQKFAAFRDAYVTFLEQPKAPLVLSLMFFYRLGDIMMGAMAQPMLADIGVDLAHRATLNGIGFWAFVGGSLVGGVLVARLGFERCLVPLTYVQNLAIPLYAGLAFYRPTFAHVVPVVLAEQLASGLGNTSHSVFLMRRSRSAFSASHYAFATGIVSLGSTLSGYLSGWLNQAVGHVWFFVLAFVASWPALVLVLLVPRSTVDEGTSS
jgi:PAT family beta-lactamase induction signal transducer AmpG